MNHQRHGMLSIGGFSSAARLSLKALRLYDQLDILKPTYVDPESGYRYYLVAQLSQARLIRLMRHMDMPLATIRQVLAAAPADAETLVHTYWQAREERMEQARRMVPDLVWHLRQEVRVMALDVQVKMVDPQPVISLTKRVTVEHLDAHIKDSVRVLSALADEQGGTVTGPPFGIYHGPVNHDDDGPMEVCLPVQGVQVGGAAVATRKLAGGRVAYVVLHGEQCTFPAALEGYDAVYDWIRQNGYEAVAPPCEIWLGESGGAERMEVAWLFRESTAG